MSTNHIEPYKPFKIEKRDKKCVLGNYRKKKLGTNIIKKNNKK